MAANEITAAARELTQVLTADVVLRHESNEVNTRNNRGFAIYRGTVVEIVRKCRLTSLIRHSLVNNEYTFEKVTTEELKGYDHPVRSN